MSYNFLKNIVEGNIDEDAHGKFTRFGKGTYEREEMVVKFSKKNVQIIAGPEYANTIVTLFALDNEHTVAVKGKMSAKKGQDKRFHDAGINLTASRATAYTIEHTFSAAEFKQFVEDFGDFLFLFVVKAGPNQIKIKTSVPKPGNILEKFVNAKLEPKYEAVIKEEFLFDCNKDVKEARFKNTYEIEDIIVDPELLESDPLKARLSAKRKGKIVRKITADGVEDHKEYYMEV